MSDDKYIFQDEKNEKFEILLNEEIKYFKGRVRLNPEKIYAAREEEVIKNFVYENIMNADWYKTRTKKERSKRKWYIFATVALLILIPFSVFYATYWLDKLELTEGPQVITGFITVILTSVLGLHSFFSHLIENRKFLSQFHRTFTELRNILFRIDGKWNKLGAALAHGLVVSPVFIDELVAGTKQSRKIVEEDTLEYFDKLASPAFDLRSSLVSNAKVAKQLVKDFQAVDFERKKTDFESEKDRAIQKIRQKEDKMEGLEEELLILQNQHARLAQRIETFEDELAELKAQAAGEEAIREKEEEIDQLEQELEPVEWELALVNTKIEQLRNSLQSEREVL